MLYAVIQSFIVRQIVQLKTINTRRTPRCHFNENKIYYFAVFFYSGTKVMEPNWDRRVGVTDCSVLFVFFW